MENKSSILYHFRNITIRSDDKNLCTEGLYLIIGKELKLQTDNQKTEDYLEFYDQFRKFHAVAGLLGLFSVVSVPATMLLLGDNQSIEQSLFTIGYFFIGIEYFFYKGKGRNWGFLSDLTERETEIVNLIIENIKAIQSIFFMIVHTYSRYH